MFDGIKLLCLAKKDNNIVNDCLHSVIVPSEKFIKIANKSFRCPECGRENSQLASFFLQLTNLQKATREFRETGFYVRCYGLGFESCHEDGFEITPHILENNDWGFWNMQISSIIIAYTENPGYRIDIWEDHFLKALPYVYPLWPTQDLTFSQVLRRKTIYVQDHEVKDIILLKNLLKEIRNYNNSWKELLGSFMSAAPVDLKNGLNTHLAEVDTLAELFSDETYK